MQRQALRSCIQWADLLKESLLLIRQLLEIQMLGQKWQWKVLHAMNCTQIPIESMTELPDPTLHCQFRAALQDAAYKSNWVGNFPPLASPNPHPLT